jgi:hypothetical protein
VHALAAPAASKLQTTNEAHCRTLGDLLEKWHERTPGLLDRAQLKLARSGVNLSDGVDEAVCA